MAKEWKELKNSEVVQLEEGEGIEGQYISIEESKMYKDSYAITLKAKDGNRCVFVSNIVRDLIQKNNVVPGEEIMLHYTGKKKSPKSGLEYKTYSLSVKR